MTEQSNIKRYRLWCPEKSDVIITKHVRFAEDKIGYEWLYKNSVVHHYKLNQSWSESDSKTESDSTATSQSNKSKAKKIDPPQTSEDESEHSIGATRRHTRSCGKVGAAESLQQQEKVTTSKRVIRNPYGRRGKQN